MIKRLFFGWVMLLISLTGIRAQNANDVLMTVGTDTVTAGEFEYMYTKNLDLVQDPKQKDVDYYKDLFIKYKLQLADAKAKGLDKDWSFKSEYSRYRRELAKKYLTDEHEIERLMREAYDRMHEDLNVAHIMIRLPDNPSPADTLAAYRKIKKIRKRLMRGENFNRLAVQYSEDESAKQNKGNLGWITVFQSIYPFESAAYATAKGQISQPVRTKYGYHLIWVKDRRPAVYKVQVKQILIIKGNNPKQAGQQIRQIYAQLKQDPDKFDELARKYSQDKRTAKLGGLMQPFGLREKIPVFEEHAFALKHPGDISEPFQSEHAWHILQLVRHDTVPPYEKIKAELRKRVMSDDRSKLARQAVLEKVRKMFPVKHLSDYRAALPYIDNRFFERQWQLPKDWSKLEKVLFVINNDQKVTLKEFLRWLYHHQLNNKDAARRKSSVLKKLYGDFTDEYLMRYYENHLENLYPEFARTSREYHDGLLLFSYKSKEIWEKALNDTLGLENYYKTHAGHYRQPARYRVLTLKTKDKRLARKVYKTLKKGGDTRAVNALVGKKAVTDVRIVDRKMMPSDLLKKKYLMQKSGNEYTVQAILQEIPEHVPPLKEIRGKVLGDYQAELEKQLLEELRKKYPVHINETVWQQIRAKYKNQ